MFLPANQAPEIACQYFKFTSHPLLFYLNSFWCSRLCPSATNSASFIRQQRTDFLDSCSSWEIICHISCDFPGQIKKLRAMDRLDRREWIWRMITVGCWCRYYIIGQWSINTRKAIYIGWSTPRRTKEDNVDFPCIKWFGVPMSRQEGKRIVGLRERQEIREHKLNTVSDAVNLRIVSCKC